MKKITGLAYKFANLGYRSIQALFGFKTLGPRAIVVNAQNQVLLVKHTYTADWYLPGGGVNKGESVQAALTRELMEELGLSLAAPAEFFGIYHNTHHLGTDDFPVIYIVRHYLIGDASSPEIEQKAWFDYDKLPTSVSPATRRRLTEFFTRSLQSESW
jgi:8-oxo-dGTP pyrophosphatase MutT (NUDIX family)